MPNRARSTNEAVKRTNSSVQTRSNRKTNATGKSTRSRRSSTTMSSTRSSQKRASSQSRSQQKRSNSQSLSQQKRSSYQTDYQREYDMDQYDPQQALDAMSAGAHQVADKAMAFFSKVKPTNSSAKRDSRKRARNKNRADKLYDKVYASSSSSSSDEGSPRAALYKGEMGSRQRKSSRMQKASKAGSVSAKLDPRGWFSNFDLKGFPLKTVTVLVCLVLTFVFLYTPAQQYYQSMRERDRLAAEYAAIEDRNVVLQNQNIALASDAGMEDAVRQKYGYVKPGESVGKVSGLSDATTDSSRDGSDIEANVLSSTVKAPEEWYTPYLDVFFGVS